MRHAFLIMAFNNYNLLERLITVLDDDRNHIYLHIDLKSSDFEEGRFRDILRKAKLTFIPREKVYWGGFSEAWCEIRLIEHALKDGFDYCHMLSGADFPIKGMNHIDDFFKNNKGKEFIEFNPNWYKLTNYKARYYHFFVENDWYRKKKWLRGCNRVLVKIQEKLHLKRHKDKLYGGSAFFSITEDFAKYVIANKADLHERYKITRAAVEVMFHTLIMGTPFQKNIYRYESPTGNLRMIDWSRRDWNPESPYVFKTDDYEMLISLPEDILFARKFDERMDWEIVEKLTQYISGK